MAESTEFDLIFPRESPSEISRQQPTKIPFTAEDVQVPSRDIPLHEQDSDCNGFSDNPNMLAGGEGGLHLELALAERPVCDNVHDKEKHDRLIGDEMVDTMYLVRGLLV